MSDEPFVCYHCKEGDCGNCVGVPCSCDYPDPKEAGHQKCCFVGCEAHGKPQEGFDFYACPPCLDKLEILMNAMYTADRSKS